MDHGLWYQAISRGRLFDHVISPLVEEHGLPVQTSFQWARDRLRRIKKFKQVEKGSPSCGLEHCTVPVTYRRDSCRDVSRVASVEQCLRHLVGT